MRPSYCLEMSYNGADFCGWQSQPHGNTIQDHTEHALRPLLGQSVRLVGASRTDSGVHAKQQFAVFRLYEARSFTQTFMDDLNARLPLSIRIKALRPVSPTFHPAFDAREKVYCYQIRCDGGQDSVPSPLHWRLYKPLDLSLLAKDLQALVGTHDFSAFCAGDSSASSKVRTISEIKVLSSEDSIEIWFRGPGFLKQMIRIIVGSSVAWAQGQKGALPSGAILAARDRRSAGRTAPAHGLCLTNVFY